MTNGYDNPFRVRFMDLFGGNEFPDPFGRRSSLGSGRVEFEHELRTEWRSEYAYAVPPDEGTLRSVIRALGSRGRRFLDWGAGTGYWAFVLESIGCDVLAMDDGSWTNLKPTWHEVVEANPGVLEHADGRTLILCWPPYSDPMALDAVRAYTGDALVYVGEGSGGCTGCNEFHGELYARWTEVASFDIPQWPGLHDRLELYARNGSIWFSSS